MSKTNHSQMMLRTALGALAFCVFSAGFTPISAQAQVNDPLATQPSNGINLLTNGDFEKLAPGGLLPENWTTKHPANVHVVHSGDEHGDIVEMTGDDALMGTYGTDLLSAPIQFKPNYRYRCTGLTRSEGPNMILFVKGFAEVHEKVKNEIKTYDDAVYQMRKEIPSTKEWRKFSLEFDVTPTREFSDLQHEVKYLRVLLWGYWPKGTCWWDNVRFEEVGPLPGRKGDKAFTNAGPKPRLSPSATQPDEEPDAEQLLNNAVNALNDDQFQQAADFAAQLLAKEPQKIEGHLVAARAAAGIKDWAAAKTQAQWLLDHEKTIENWQRDWAQLVMAQVRINTDAPKLGKETLQSLAAKATSPHVKEAAQKLLDESAKEK